MRIWVICKIWKESDLKEEKGEGFLVLFFSPPPLSSFRSDFGLNGLDFFHRFFSPISFLV